MTGAAGWKYRFRCLLPHKFFSSRCHSRVSVASEMSLQKPIIFGFETESTFVVQCVLSFVAFAGPKDSNVLEISVVLRNPDQVPASLKRRSAIFQKVHCIWRATGDLRFRSL